MELISIGAVLGMALPLAGIHSLLHGSRFCLPSEQARIVALLLLFAAVAMIAGGLLELRASQRRGLRKPGFRSMIPTVAITVIGVVSFGWVGTNLAIAGCLFS